MFLLMTVLLTACSSSKEEDVQPVEEDCFLDIYVYAPGRPIVTRGDEGEIDPISDAESKVTSLQIWVFKHTIDSDDGKLVGYLNPDPSFLDASHPQKYLMKLDRNFVKDPTNVDIYVVANAASCGLAAGDNKLDKDTSRGELDAAVISAGYFGTTDLYDIDDLKSDTHGLPMSGVLKNQPIYGSFPTLHVGEDNKMATLELTRAVSKLRFVLCQIAGNQSSNKKLVSIDRIELNGGQIPTKTYLMPGAYNYPDENFVSGATDVITYVPTAEIEKLVPVADVDQDHPEWVVIPEVTNPLVYAFETQNAQDYENLIDAAVKGNLSWLKQYGEENHVPELASLTEQSVMPQLKQIGLTYLRESDKQLKGAIQYKYQEGTNEPVPATAEFSMSAPGDFRRNHSWIIYVYYMDEKIHVLTVTHIGMKAWVPDGENEKVTVYNW